MHDPNLLPVFLLFFLIIFQDEEKIENPLSPFSLSSQIKWTASKSVPNVLTAS